VIAVTFSQLGPLIAGHTFLVLVLSMTWFDLFTGGLVLAVICGIPAVIVCQTRKETGDEAH